MNITLRELLGAIMPLFYEMDIACYDESGDFFYDECHQALLDSTVARYRLRDDTWRDSLDGIYKLAYEAFHCNDEEGPELLVVALSDYKCDRLMSCWYDADGVPIERY